jgi:hypothetical protein
MAFCRTAVARGIAFQTQLSLGVFIQRRRRGVQSRRAHGERIWHLPTTPGCDGCPNNLGAYPVMGSRQSR